MEVHAHTHTVPIAIGRKKWTHYLWEFLMLFLAVFCGFLAENKREHIVERQREKKYMVSLVNELMADTAQIRELLTDSTWIKGQDSLMNILYNTSPVSIDTRLVYYFYEEYTVYINSAILNNNTLTQLKNSGSMRLIRNKDVIDSLYLLNTIIVAVDKQFDLFLYHTYPQYSAMSARIINEKYLMNSKPGQLRQHLFSLSEKPELITYSPAALVEFANYIGRIKKTRTRYIDILRYYYNYCISLIPFIKKEYHLK